MLQAWLAPLQLPFAPDLVQSAAQLASIAGSVVLVMLLVAFGAFVYRSVLGDGIEWPGDVDDDEGGVSRAGDDEEWKYS
jgi:hypothetical protein